MERQRYRELRGQLRIAARGHRDDPRCTHRDATIVAVLLWATLHNKPIVWATQPTNWPGDLRPKPLPSQSCMSRRLRTEGVWQLLDKLDQSMRAQLLHSDVKLVDARPLTVGGCSKDPDAATGYGAGHRLRGYKLHTICDQYGAVDCWIITAMNGSEPGAAEKMIEHLDHTAYVIGDGNYDVNGLYDRAGERGIQWLTQPRRQGSRAPGNRQHSEHRLAVWQWVRSEHGQRLLFKARSGIERINAWQGQAAVGLTHLPHHIRRDHRVRVWVAAKLVLYHHWLATRPNARNAA